MRIAFLGTSCAVPTADNGFTSFLVSLSDLLILIDASGNPVQSILKAERDPLELDILILTHYHADHISGYPSLVQTLGCLKRKKVLKVLADSVTKEKA
ncbi:MAG: MBL fold metallo-hydrolase, partial [Spirochaetota bacterium]